MEIQRGNSAGEAVAAERLDARSRRGTKATERLHMRLDKWLKVSRLIKRRTVAQMACDQGRVFVNERPGKSATDIKVGDQVHLELGARAVTVQVTLVPPGAVAAQDAATLYDILEEIRRPPEVLEWLPDEDYARD